MMHVDGEVITLLTDVNHEEIRVFSSDLQDTNEVSTGMDVVGNFQLYDLVMLEQAASSLTMPSVGVIIKLETDSLQVSAVVPPLPSMASLYPALLSGPITTFSIKPPIVTDLHPSRCSTIRGRCGRCGRAMRSRRSAARRRWRWMQSSRRSGRAMSSRCACVHGCMQACMDASVRP